MTMAMTMTMTRPEAGEARNRKIVSHAVQNRVDVF